MKKLMSVVSILMLVCLLVACSSSGDSGNESSSLPASASVSTTSPPYSDTSSPTPQSEVSMASSGLAASEASGSSTDLNWFQIVEVDKETSYKVSFDLPDGLFFTDFGVRQQEIGIVPTTIYDPAYYEYPLEPDNIIGALPVSASIKGENFFMVDDTFQRWIYGDYVIFPYSEDDSLPAFTFYLLGDFIAVTVEDDYTIFERHSQRYKVTTYYIPLSDNYYAGMWFYHNPDSVGAKEYFETIINTVTVEKIN